jgi:hypothetical protein
MENIRHDLRVGRQANTGDFSDLAKELSNSVLVSVERQVANKEGLALRADSVAVLLSTVSSTLTGVGFGRTSVGVVKVEGTAVQLETLHGLVSLGGSLRVFKVDVSETAAAAAIPVGNDTGAGQALEILESFVQSIVVDVPAQVASEQGGSSLILSLGLLRGGVNLLIGLALL